MPKKVFQTTAICGPTPRRRLRPSSELNVYLPPAPVARTVMKLTRAPDCGQIGRCNVSAVYWGSHRQICGQPQSKASKRSLRAMSLGRCAAAVPGRDSIVRYSCVLCCRR